MKKIVTLILVVLMLFSLCACGENEVAESDVKMGLICLHDSNSPYDLNFIIAFEAACEAKGVEYEIKTNVPEGNEAYDAASELADNGCNIVFGDSFGFEDYMIQAAREFPDVEFCHATGTKAHTEGLDNYHNAFAAIYEGRYIDGVALGMKLNEMIDSGEIEPSEAIVGYVGAYQYAEVISGYTSFYLGVKSVCDSATMKVVFTNSWYDEAAEKEAAMTLINSGCVGISGHADSMGAPNACETTGTPFVFYNGDLSSVCPNTFIVATKINWQPYFEYIIDCKRNNEPILADYVGTISTQSVVMTDVNTEAMADGTKEAIEYTIDQFINDELNVFDTARFTVNGEHISTYMADVDSDANYEADTEAIKDGVFYESVYRSAPYFDITIDGIEIL